MKILLLSALILTASNHVTIEEKKSIPVFREYEMGFTGNWNSIWSNPKPREICLVFTTGGEYRLAVHGTTGWYSVNGFEPSGSVEVKFWAHLPGPPKVISEKEEKK
jgi:hypothetical protein